jgi:hypothetical protein
MMASRFLALDALRLPACHPLWDSLWTSPLLSLYCVSELQASSRVVVNEKPALKTSLTHLILSETMGWVSWGFALIAYSDFIARVKSTTTVSHSLLRFFLRTNRNRMTPSCGRDLTFTWCRLERRALRIENAV